ncbi:MAG: sugar ABC transporter permease [Clostridia bacterium]|nr:sugar ABC transporter permease [Clostridia bacterium]
MLILATGVILLVISLLFYIANNKTSKICLSIVRDKWLYVLLMPGLIYFVIFKYLPMWGVVIAFQEYVPYSGIFGSEWVGFNQFIRFFHTPMLKKLFVNTLLLSFMNLVLYFPAPIFLSLLLNEMRRERYKKLVQTFLYVPHFISIVIVVSITYVIFDSDGLIGRLSTSLLGKKIDFLTDPGVFRWMIVGQSIWKETGWGTIIFLAALTNVDVQLYEAAMVDGAGRMRQMWHITLPAIRSTIVLLLILRMGSVLDTGYDHLILMSNAMNREVSQTFDVFVYEQGINSADYSYATAVGLFKSVISVTLVITSNKIAHALGEPGLY